MVSRMKEAQDQVGTLQKLWDSLKSSASFAWDAMLGVGRPTTQLGTASAAYEDLLKQRSAVADVANGNSPSLIASSNLPLNMRGIQAGGAPSAAAQAAAQSALATIDA